MRLRCLIGIHKWFDIKSGPVVRYLIPEKGVWVDKYDRMCSRCGKLDNRVSREQNKITK